VIHENLGIRHGSITTIHDVTNTQTIVDRPAKDLRRARSALNSLIPTTTGSATAITLIYPELTGKHETRPLVSADYTNDIRSSIIDAPSTMVVNGTQVKIYAWYDNEMGYAYRLVDVALMVGKSLSK